MKYLFDTNPFLLWASDSSQLSANVRALIKRPASDLYLSLASVREIQIKSQIGILNLFHPMLKIRVEQHDMNRITLLPIGINLTIMLQKLPNFHPDPFDRLIIAQSLSDDMTIITNDPLIKLYPVKTIW